MSSILYIKKANFNVSVFLGGKYAPAYLTLPTICIGIIEERIEPVGNHVALIHMHLEQKGNPEHD